MSEVQLQKQPVVRRDGHEDAASILSRHYEVVGDDETNRFRLIRVPGCMNCFQRMLPAVALFLMAACGTVSVSDSSSARIQALVDKATTTKATQEAAFGELQAMGDLAVPYLVSHLCDTRPLASPSITFSNSSADSFEGYRHYSPKTVHDAISAILNKRTGRSFVAVYNGGTVEQRNQNHREWVAWCRSAYSENANACGEVTP